MNNSAYYVYKRLVWAKGLISRGWYYKTKARVFFSKKIKIGFGPITTAEDDLSVRKWRIDQVIDQINNTSKKYVAGFFIEPKEMAVFDVIVIVKNFNPEFVKTIVELKKQGKKFIYDIVDNPACEEKYKFYYAQSPEFLKLMDAFILSSPLQENRVRPYTENFALIEHPVISQLYKKDYSQKEEINIVTQGYAENLEIVQKLEPIIKKLAEENGKKINLVYHSNKPPKNIRNNIKYIPWTVKNCFKVLVEADIGVSVKDLGNVYQKEKPATKVITFMAAGLPVVCTPTEADKLAVEDGKTGFLAGTEGDWEEKLKQLILDAGLRKKIGKAARAEAIEKYSINKITDKYLTLLDRLNTK